MANRFTKGTGLFGTIKTGAIYLGSTLLAFTAAQFNQVMAAFGTVTFDRGVKVAKKSIGGAALHAGVLAWQNPEAGSILITRIVVNLTTKSTGASTTDIGTTATSATTASDNLLDGIDTGAAAAVFDNADDTDNGTNGKTKQLLAAGKWVTFKEASGDATGLVADAYIHYVTV